MRLRADDPHLRVLCKDSASWYLPVEAEESFKHAWMNGKSFWDGVSLWGDPVIIRLGDIVGFCHKTADGIALQEAEHEEERRRKVLTGDE